MASPESSRHAPAFHQLQSQAQVELLDAIDELRLGGELNLPQLVVVGDQSSGKSSVLEAISGVRFPTNDELCTRFASELILRRTKNSKFSVKISPAPKRSAEEKQLFEGFSSETDCTDLEHFPDVVLEALNHIDNLEHRSKFFEDKLVAQIEGPHMPPLTLVDLPGLIHDSDGAQADNDIATVKKPVESYMSQPNSIILAVIAANNNFANQEVLRLLKSGLCGLERSLGIITKPDLADQGSAAEKLAIQHAHNQVVHLKLGWHVLVNRGFKERDLSVEERNSNEAQFFATSNWSEVSCANFGASTLRDKLSNILLKAIQTNLPRIQSDVKNKIADSEALASKLGEANVTEGARRQQLTSISTELHGSIEAGTGGDYAKSFFYERSKHNMASRRLRADLREYLESFDNSMRVGGKHFWYAEADQDPAIGKLDFSLPSNGIEAGSPTLLLSYFTLERSVEDHIRRNRGQEPEGIIPSIVYLSILSYQCAKWEPIATMHAEGCWKIVHEFFREALSDVSPPHIVAAVLEKHADSHFEQTERKLLMRVKELVRPYTNRTFFTLNKSDLAIKTAEVKYEWEDSVEDPSSAYANMDSYASHPAWVVLNWVFAAYELALNTFIDNFATFAIEHCLVESLYNLFTPLEVAGMSAEEVKLLTAEPIDVVDARHQNKARLQKLRSALKVCNQHMGMISDIKQPQPFRKGTADDLTEQLQACTISPPTPNAGPSSGTPPTAKKSNHRSLHADPFMPTPPRTPSRHSSSSGQANPMREKQRPGSAASRSSNRRREHTPEHVAQTARTVSPLQTSMDATRSPVHGELTSEEL